MHDLGLITILFSPFSYKGQRVKFKVYRIDVVLSQC